MKNKKLLVTQTNQLIEAQYKLTLNEKRLVMLAISKMDSKRDAIDEPPPMIEINVDEWKKIYHLTESKNVYSDIKKATIKLRSRGVTIFSRNKGAAPERYINWVDSCEYYPREARIKISFSYSMCVMLTGKWGYFAAYDLHHVSQLTSITFCRLYELIWRYLKNSKKDSFAYIELTDLRKSLDMEKSYPIYSDFRKRVIENGLKEINQFTNIEVDYEAIPKGNKIHAIKFFYKKGNQLDLLGNSNE